MSDRKLELGTLVKALREQRGTTQEDLVKELNLENRSILAHLEQGLRIPPLEVLKTICSAVKVPISYYAFFVEPDWMQVAIFEESLSELTGLSLDLSRLDDSCKSVARDSIVGLFKASLNNVQARDWFNSILVHYDVRPTVSQEFFERYLGSHVFRTPEKFKEAVERYQAESIRLFNSFEAAYQQLNKCPSLESSLSALKANDGHEYFNRSDWDGIESIESGKLQNLGYIAAAELKKEENERIAVSNFLNELATTIESDGKEKALSKFSDRKKRSMDSLLRKFNSTLPHGVFSPLFISDSDRLRRESKQLAPRNDQDINQIRETQAQGLRNLARYLSADHLDVYVATSMRLDADFVSVNQFVNALFENPDIKKFKLRYFNPTQSWIQDRVAKGLVEALMLRRAKLTIYMAQKEDSFGKDSEASVALGQGKPVIVYVPKLTSRQINVDSEQLSNTDRKELLRILAAEGGAEDAEFDETVDDLGLLSRVLEIRLSKASLSELSQIALEHWADFGLTTESASERIHDDTSRAQFRTWVDSIKNTGQASPLPEGLRADFVRLLVSTATNFEKRSRLFREQHPLALQVILKSGILNGMIVVRSIESCSAILRALLLNDLDLKFIPDEHNYKLVEQTTKSTIRVISRHSLINSAFATHYSGTAAINTT